MIFLYWKAKVKLLGSLRAKARLDVRRYISENPELRLFQRGTWGRTVDFLFKGRGPIQFVVLYSMTATGIAIGPFFLPAEFLELLQNNLMTLKHDESEISQLNRHFLGVQATLIGIVFPIVIALVALLLQRHGRALSKLRADIYYKESRTFEILSSCITLIVALMAQQFQVVPMLFTLISPAEDAVLFMQTKLTIVHGIWLTLNVVAIWGFLVFSFSFINLRRQRTILRRFMARESIPEELEDRFIHERLEELNVNHCIIYGKVGIDVGEVEVEKRKGYGVYILHDIKCRFTELVASKWLFRTNRDENLSLEENSFLPPRINFPREIGEKSFGSICLCRREGGDPLSKFEEILIKHSFVFKRIEE